MHVLLALSDGHLINVFWPKDIFTIVLYCNVQLSFVAGNSYWTVGSTCIKKGNMELFENFVSLYHRVK